MKRVYFARTLAVCIVFCFCLLPSLAQQASTASSTVVVPHLIRLAGVLKDSSGHPLAGIAGITFALYRDQEGGAALWLETQNAALDANGRYDVLLGAEHSEGVPMDLFTSGEARWLGIQVQGHTAEQPRVLLVSVPYALKAADAETVGGLPPSAFVLAAPLAGSGASFANSAASNAPSASASPLTTSNVTTTGGTGNTIAMFTGVANIQNSILTQTSTTAINVGGKLTLPATGTATATNDFGSRPELFVASAYNSGTKATVAQTFQLAAEPVGSNTASPSGTLNLLYGAGTATPTETGLKISSNGLISFANAQTFPGTIAAIHAGTDLSSNSSNGIATVSLNTAATDSRYARLNNQNIFQKPNTFAGLVTVIGNSQASLKLGDVGCGVLTVGLSFSLPDCRAAALIGDFAGDTILNRPSGDKMSFRENNGADQLTIATGGNVGIGTSAPLNLLDVAGLQHTLIGNPGCGGAFGGIGFGTGALADCAHYSLLGEGVHTYLNRPQGGQILFREGNNTEMVLASGGLLGIGTTTPSYLLHVNGNMRAETGLSLGGSAVLSVDAPGVPAGRFGVSTRGVSIGGDTPMNSNPHMSFSGMYFGSLCNNHTTCGPETGTSWGGFVPDRPILITRVTATINNPIDPSCLPGAILVGGFGVPLPANSNLLDVKVTPPQPVGAGDALVISAALANPLNCNFGASAGGNIFINVQYVMQ